MARRTSTFLLLTALIGCSDVLSIPSDPKLVASGPWRCLSQPTSAPVGASVAQAQVQVQACNFITDCKTTVTGLTATLCDKLDVGCINPRVVGITETNGAFQFNVPTAGGGFNGYLLVDSRAASCTDSEAFGAVAGKGLCDLVAPQCDLSAPDARCFTKVFAPAMLFFNPAIVRDTQSPLPLQMFPISGLPAVIAAAGIQVDPAAGNLFIQALDCDGNPAAGVKYQIQQFGSQVSQLYVNNGIVSSAITQTDPTGIGGFIRVPPGFVSVIGYNSDSVAVGQIGVQTAPSTLTYTALTPLP
jgi:hypothetical protein